jgi:hypothetical protein
VIAERLRVIGALRVIGPLHALRSAKLIARRIGGDRRGIARNCATSNAANGVLYAWPVAGLDPGAERA